MEIEQPHTVFRIAEIVVSEIDENVRSACWRRHYPVVVRRHHAEYTFRMRSQVQVKIDAGRGCVADQHLVAIESECTHAVEILTVVELIAGHVISVQPDPKLGIIRKLRPW